jgi:hypothetical protein
MARQKSAPLPIEVAATAAKLEAWRKAPRIGSRMPEELWSEIAGLARQLGVNPISRAMGLNFTDLRKRVEQGRGLCRVPTAGAPTFVELSLDPGTRMRAPGEASSLLGGIQSGPVVEVFSPDGCRLVMHFPDGVPVDTHGLVASFLGRSR